MLTQIRHIVVLMMENHSFDQHLGTLGRGDGLPVDESGTPTSTNPGGDGRVVRAHRMATTTQQEGVPVQTWENVHQQWADGRLDGFVRAAEGLRADADPEVAMPEAVEPDDVAPRDGGPWRFDRLGIRVPAVVVAPFARADHVSSVVRDHTAVLRLIQRTWNLPPLTRRDAEADDLLDCLDLDGPPAFLDPPALPAPALAP